jgi:hypothetical protein
MNDDDRRVVAYTTDDPVHANILCDALRSEGIPCQLEGERQGGLASLPMMEIKLLVRAGDLDRAHVYLEQTELDEEDDDEQA